MEPNVPTPPVNSSWKKTNYKDSPHEFVLTAKDDQIRYNNTPGDM
jgi:hypothetical protein